MTVNILIAGLGLLGGSLALRIKETDPSRTISAFGRNRERLERAMDAGFVDAVSTDPSELVPDADMIVIGTPVGTIPKIGEVIQPYLKPGAVITDMGSTKDWICRNMERILRRNDVSFVGSHPMAGSEKTGFENSRADLFQGATVVITTTEKTSPEAVGRVRAMWEETGALVRTMSPEHHDKLVARTSHLPHAVAFAMAYALSKTEDARDNFHGIYGRGLLDTLRIAASDPVMWEDIIRTNRLNIADALEDYRGYLDVLENWIRQGHYDEIVALMKAAGELRKGL